MSDIELGIFEMLKSRPGELSAKALRQRSIIRLLAEKTNQQDRTRTGLARSLAASSGSKWQTVYPAIFVDMERVMVPLDIVREEGRLTVRRGPKMMQERGSPYYSLTPNGVVVSLAVRDPQGQDGMMEEMAKMGPYGEALYTLAEGSPALVRHIIEAYVRAWCRDGFDLLPLDLTRIKNDTTIRMCRSLVEAYHTMDDTARETITSLLRDAGGP